MRKIRKIICLHRESVTAPAWSKSPVFLHPAVSPAAGPFLPAEDFFRMSIRVLCLLAKN